MSSSGAGDSEVDSGLHWRIHLLRQKPDRLPALLMVLAIGATCVWLMFGALLPVLAAVALLTGSVSDYLFPISYRLTNQEVALESLTARIALPWKEVRRCRLHTHAILLTSLAAPSRLDAFRGIFLRFAPDGQPGDRQSVLTALTTFAPHLLLTPK